VSLGLQRAINANNLIKIFTNDGITTYPYQTTFNLNMYQGGLQWTNTDSLQNHILIAQVVFGEYLSRDASTPYNSSTFYGFNFNDTYRLTSKTNLSVGAMYQGLWYRAVQFPYAEKEKDDYFNINGTYSYLFTPNLVWSFTVSYSNNYSNLFIKKYNRYLASTGISYAF
jgi:hypothetical protein